MSLVHTHIEHNINFCNIELINIKNTKILKGITIGNIDVSEMTTEEAIKVENTISSETTIITL